MQHQPSPACGLEGLEVGQAAWIHQRVDLVILPQTQPVFAPPNQIPEVKGLGIHGLGMGKKRGVLREVRRDDVQVAGVTSHRDPGIEPGIGGRPVPGPGHFGVGQAFIHPEIEQGVVFLRWIDVLIDRKSALRIGWRALPQGNALQLHKAAGIPHGNHVVQGLCLQTFADGI